MPDVNFSSSFTRIGPTSSISMPIGGTVHNLELYPPNVYNATVSINENIYDFGKTEKSLVIDQKAKEMVQISTEQIKQKLSTAVMANYYAISFLQEAISIKDEQLKNLNEHLSYIEKRLSTGSATKFEVLSTKVRISSIENQKTDLQTALKIQISQLNSLMGKSSELPLAVSKSVLSIQQHHADRFIA
ncbi:MAG: TolC family protein [Paludibacter sp.]